MNTVLVLNATYEPLNVVPVRRAIVLLLKEKAELLEAASERVRSADVSLPVPVVIRLLGFVQVPRPLTVPCSRRAVMMRDNFTCQYCGAQPAKSELTVDHVVPRSRGGDTTWENVVCSCKPCNLRKGSHTPEEVGLRLRATPHRPRYVAVMSLSRAPEPATWGKYLDAWTTA